MSQTIKNLKTSNLNINDISEDHQYIIGVSELTADRTLNLPLLTNNDTITVVSLPQTLTNKTFPDDSTIFQDNSDPTKQMQFQLAGISTGSTRILTIPDTNDTLVVEAESQILTNKTINADNNTITNIDNDDIKVGAAIDATKIADGSVSNTEFQYLDGLTSNIQTQLDNMSVTTSGGIVNQTDEQTLSNKTLIDDTTTFQDESDSTKQMRFQLSGISTGSIRILTIPDINDTLVVLSELQTLTNKSIDADNNTITNIDNDDIKISAAIDASKIADGSVSNTEFQYINSLTSNAQTQITNHTTNTSNPHSVTASQVGNGTAQWNADKIRDKLIQTGTPSNYDQIYFNSTSDEWEYKNYFDDELTSAIYDDFIRAEISSQWVIDTFGNDSDVGVIDGVGGQIQLISNDSANDYSEISYVIKTINLSSETGIKIRLKINQTTNNIITFGSISDVNNKVLFSYDVSGTPGNWFTKTYSGGSTTSNDTSVSSDTNWHIYKIIYSSSSIKFYIDNTLVSTHTTNLPSSLMRFYIRQESKTTSQRSLNVDYIKITSDREGNTTGSGGDSIFAII